MFNWYRNWKRKRKIEAEKYLGIINYIGTDVGIYEVRYKDKVDLHIDLVFYDYEAQADQGVYHEQYRWSISKKNFTEYFAKFNKEIGELVTA